MIPIHLRIKALWDGSPAAPGEEYALTLREKGADILITLEAPYFGDPSPPHPPGRTPELWNYEVVEVFILGEGERYTEVELGPGGHYLALKLEGRRNIIEDNIPLKLSVSIDEERGRWEGRARIHGSYLPPKPWKVNAFAIHGEGDKRRYLAHAKAGGESPDFHDLEGFVEVGGVGLSGG